MKLRSNLLCLILALGLGLWPISATAQEGRFDIGLRFNAMGASGKPTNDILGTGVFGRYRLNEKWFIGVGFDQADEFDVERPYEFLGLVGEPAAETDTLATSTTVSSWIERVYEKPGRHLEWFWTLGLGVVTLDVDPVSGLLADGGVYDIRTDAGSEFVALGSAGLRIRFGQWAFESALRFDQHFADWAMVDNVSGATTTIDDYLVKGVHLGLSYRIR